MDPVKEFIDRRFKADCNWLNGNCYYFALILSDRFPGGTIYYDVIYGHFIYLYEGKYYDWSGVSSQVKCRNFRQKVQSFLASIISCNGPVVS